MPLVETLPVGGDTAQWSVWGTVARVVVTDPAAIEDAAALVRTRLAEVDAAASRFRPDSEIRAVARAGGRPVRISRGFAELVSVALAAARDTGGDVDPTLGTALCALGYDRDFASIGATSVPTTQQAPTQQAPTREAAPQEVAARGAAARDAGTRATVVRAAVVRAADWRAVRLDGDLLTVPAGVLLDLGATAKAFAADVSAATIAATLSTGALVALGGDIATAGPAPAGGWHVLVKDGPAEPECTVTLPPGAAVATSSTIARSWRHGERAVHHILDPRSLHPVPPRWRTISVAAHTCVRANTLATAALVRGRNARRLLAATGAPARLVAADGRVTTLGAWPAERGPR